MKAPTTYNAWTKFAENISGQTSFIPAGYFNFDNTYQITTANEIIKLVWADQPEKGRGPFVNSKTLFYYNLGQNSTLELKIYKNDFWARLLTVFSANKLKIDDTNLDSEYLFFSNNELAAGKFLNDFKNFNSLTKFKDFVINTEIIDDDKFLVIQVNNLLTEEKPLMQFYKLGQVISQSLNGGV